MWCAFHSWKSSTLRSLSSARHTSFTGIRYTAVPSNLYFLRLFKQTSMLVSAQNQACDLGLCLKTEDETNSTILSCDETNRLPVPQALGNKAWISLNVGSQPHLLPIYAPGNHLPTHPTLKCPSPTSSLPSPQPPGTYADQDWPAQLTSIQESMLVWGG